MKFPSSSNRVAPAKPQAPESEASATKGSRAQADIAPVDVLAGLGGADRDMLATFLALFDDSQLKRRMAKRAESAYDWLTSKTSRQNEADAPPALPDPDSAEQMREDARELGERQHYWRNSEHSDDMLRLLLWVRLREALDLPAELTTTHRGCHHLADDMVAKLLNTFDSPDQKKSSQRWLQKLGRNKDGGHDATFSDIVIPILDQLLKEQSDDETPSQRAKDPEARRQELAEALSLMGSLNNEQVKRALNGEGVDRINDAAVRNTAMLGGSMGALGTAVGASGFAPYLLAAKASAFVPMVSGPGLVSFVAVISNPITIALVSLGGGYLVLNKASDRTNAHVASHIMALLALNGLRSGRQALTNTLRAFALTPHLTHGADATHKRSGHKTAARYQTAWQRLAGLADMPDPRPSAEITTLMSRPLEPTTGSEAGNMAAVTGLTLGDMLYNLAAIDPGVVQAADFSRSADIDSSLAFANLAEQIQESHPAAATGAINQLKGYVAEHAVAAQLIAQGHTVSLPDSASQPGWDLLVDGQPMQVKFHDGLGGLQQHFQFYDYPVIANTELQGQVPAEWREHVFFIDGLSNTHVEALTRASLEAGAEVFNPEVIPAPALVTLTRSMLAYRRGQLSARQTLEQIMLDGSVRIGLAGAGSAAGPFIGTALFGPAGGVVFGVALPVLSQALTPQVSRSIKHKASGEQYRQWSATAHQHLDALHGCLLDALADKRQQIDSKLAECPDTPEGAYLRWRLNDDRRHSQEVQIHLCHLRKAEEPGAEKRLRATLELLALAGLHPVHYQAELSTVTRHFEQRPGLGATVKDWTSTAAEGALVGTLATGMAVSDTSKAAWKAWRKSRGKK
ncbi:hypothetical protein QWY74_05340 [Halomonas almeriensis]|uniref:hypothetical protein n=1 Tax=Halomonas almeriensis TaxID=308163 RepID=UPI0025B2B7E2|nr:hypothetical protein [Halomonas almeriensis]MDN3552895.1 hypothetical protein [Halomonas almeriensis]